MGPFWKLKRSNDGLLFETVLKVNNNKWDLKRYDVPQTFQWCYNWCMISGFSGHRWFSYRIEKKIINKQILSFQTTFVVTRLPGKLMHQNSHKDFKYNSFSNEEKLAARS